MSSHAWFHSLHSVVLWLFSLYCLLLQGHLHKVDFFLIILFYNLCGSRLLLLISWIWYICKIPNLRSFSVSVAMYNFYVFILLLFGDGSGKACVPSKFLFFYFSCRICNCPSFLFSFSPVFPKDVLSSFEFFSPESNALQTACSVDVHWSPFAGSPLWLSRTLQYFTSQVDVLSSSGFKSVLTPPSLPSALIHTNFQGCAQSVTYNSAGIFFS